MTVQIYPSVEIPSQTENSGKYLTTNGSNTSWGTVITDSMTVLATGTLSASSVTISKIPQTYRRLILTLNDATVTSGASYPLVYINDERTSDYRAVPSGTNYSSIRVSGNTNSITTSNTNGFFVSCSFENYTSTTSYKTGAFQGVSNSAGLTLSGGWEKYSTVRTTAITSIVIETSSSTYSGGTYTLYGVK